MLRILLGLGLALLFAAVLVWSTTTPGSWLAPEISEQVEALPERASDRVLGPSNTKEGRLGQESTRSPVLPSLEPISLALSVLDFETGKVVPSARIRIFPTKAGAGKLLGWLSAKGESEIRFVLPRALQQDHVIVIAAPGYRSASMELSSLFGDLESADSKIHVKWELTKGRNLHGRVLDASGRTVQGLLLRMDIDGQLSWTDEKGLYQVVDHEMSEFIIEASREEQGTVIYDIHRKPSDPPRLPDLIFGGDGSIKALLQYVDGRPLKGRDLHLESALVVDSKLGTTADFRAEATTDNQGRVEFKGMSHGTYSLELKIADGAVVFVDHDYWLELADAITPRAQEQVFRFQPLRLQVEFPEMEASQRSVSIAMSLPGENRSYARAWSPLSPKVDMMIPFLIGTRVDVVASIQGKGWVSATRTIEANLEPSPIVLRVPTPNELVAVVLSIQDPALKKTTSLYVQVQAGKSDWHARKVTKSKDGRFQFVVPPGKCDLSLYLVDETNKRVEQPPRQDRPESIQDLCWFEGTESIVADAGTTVSLAWTPQKGASFSYLFELAGKPAFFRLGTTKVSVLSPPGKHGARNYEPQREEDVREGRVYEFDSMLVPGLHSIRFEVPGYAPVTRKIKLLPHTNQLLRIRLEIP